MFGEEIINNNDEEIFRKNSEATSKLLRESGAAKSAEHYRSQLFPELSAEETNKIYEVRQEALKDPYKTLRESLRKDLQ